MDYLLVTVFLLWGLGLILPLVPLVCFHFSLRNTCPLSRKNSVPLGEFSMSLLSTTGCTLTSSFTDRSIPFTEGTFLWIIVLWSFVRPSASKVLFCQYGRPIPLRMRVTACSLATSTAAFLDAIICTCCRTQKASEDVDLQSTCINAEYNTDKLKTHCARFGSPRSVTFLVCFN